MLLLIELETKRDCLSSPFNKSMLDKRLSHILEVERSIIDPQSIKSCQLIANPPFLVVNASLLGGLLVNLAKFALDYCLGQNYEQNDLLNERK
jgi:hypothetical protein